MSVKGPSRVRLKSLADLDRRTSAAKSAFLLRDQIVSDLGGDDSLTAMKRVLIDRVAVLEAALNDIAAGYLCGEPSNMAVYSTLANSQRRLLQDLGLERRAADVTPHHSSLSSYLASKRAPAIDQAVEPEELEPEASTGP